MPARIVINGRVVVASPDSHAAERARRNELTAKGWADVYATATTEPGADVKSKVVAAAGAFVPLAPLPLPKPAPAQPTFVQDEGSGVRFRIEPKLSVDLGWVTANTIGRWFDIQPHTVHHLARVGLLDAAMEMGSPTRRFRVLNTTKVRSEIARLREERRAVLEKESKRRALLDDPSSGASILAKMKLLRTSPTGRPRSTKAARRDEP